MDNGEQCSWTHALGTRPSMPFTVSHPLVLTTLSIRSRSHLPSTSNTHRHTELSQSMEAARNACCSRNACGEHCDHRRQTARRRENESPCAQPSRCRASAEQQPPPFATGWLTAPSPPSSSSAARARPRDHIAGRRKALSLIRLSASVRSTSQFRVRYSRVSNQFFFVPSPHTQNQQKNG